MVSSALLQKDSQINMSLTLLSMLLSNTCSQIDIFGYKCNHLKHKSPGFFLNRTLLFGVYILMTNSLKTIFVWERLGGFSNTEFGEELGDWLVNYSVTFQKRISYPFVLAIIWCEDIAHLSRKVWRAFANFIFSLKWTNLKMAPWIMLRSQITQPFTVLFSLTVKVGKWAKYLLLKLSCLSSLY